MKYVSTLLITVTKAQFPANATHATYATTAADATAKEQKYKKPSCR